MEKTASASPPSGGRPRLAADHTHKEPCTKIARAGTVPFYPSHSREVSVFIYLFRAHTRTHTHTLSLSHTHSLALVVHDTTHGGRFGGLSGLFPHTAACEPPHSSRRWATSASRSCTYCSWSTRRSRLCRPGSRACQAPVCRSLKLTRSANQRCVTDRYSTSRWRGERLAVPRCASRMSKRTVAPAGAAKVRVESLPRWSRTPRCSKEADSDA